MTGDLCFDEIWSRSDSRTKIGVYCTEGGATRHAWCNLFDFGDAPGYQSIRSQISKPMEMKLLQFDEVSGMMPFRWVLASAMTMDLSKLVYFCTRGYRSHLLALTASG